MTLNAKFRTVLHISKSRNLFCYDLLEITGWFLQEVRGDIFDLLETLLVGLRFEVAFSQILALSPPLPKAQSVLHAIIGKSCILW